MGNLNREMVNDTAKLIMHRLVSRKIGRDPAIVERAKRTHSEAARRYAGRTFVLDWNRLLDLRASELRARLICKDSEMTRLRLSSPFLVRSGIDFTDYDFRLRIGRAARRIVERSLRKSNSVLRA